MATESSGMRRVRASEGGLTCSRCGLLRPFVKKRWCAECNAAYQREYYVANKGRLNAYSHEYGRQNKDDIAANKRQYHIDNVDRIRAAKVARYKRQSETIKAKRAAYVARNWTRIVDERRARRESDPQYRLECAIRSGIRRGLSPGVKARRRTVALLGYTYQMLQTRLESLFEPGMTWDNYGAWEVDHIIPLSAFNYEKPDDIDFKRAWALSNLQPLWKSDNCSKRASLARPFQPSLLIG